MIIYGMLLKGLIFFESKIVWMVFLLMVIWDIGKMIGFFIIMEGEC